MNNKNKIIRSINLTPSTDDENSTFKTDKKASLKVQNGKKILKLLGYNEINDMADSEIYELTNAATSIVVGEEYFKVDKNGKATSIDKDACLNEVNKIKHQENVENAITLYSSNDGYNDETSSDNYMVITTTASYISSGYYTMSGRYTWLTMPAYTMTDAWSLAAPECAWLTGSSNVYAEFMYKYYSRDYSEYYTCVLL